MKLFRILAALAAFATMALLFAAPASAQATRTWVSGTGDDANPCSRTAPCKTFAGAIAKTTASGEINCIDTGGFGALTITKAITISCEAGTAGVLVSGTNGFVVAAGATDAVIIKGLDFNGIGPTGGSLNGIRINSAGNVLIDHCVIYGFGSTNGVDGNGVFVNTSAGVHVTIIDTVIANNANTGILLKPTGSAGVRATIRNVEVSNNGGDGVMFNATATTGSIKGVITQTESTHNGNGNGFAVLSVGADNEAMIDSSTASDNTNGIAANGAGAIARFTRTNVTGNSTGVKQVNGGSSVSYGTNSLDGNGVGGNGSFSTAAQQ